MSQTVHHSLHIPPEYAGFRLDQALAKSIADYSRAKLCQWIKEGAVKVDGNVWTPKQKVQGGEHVEINGELQILSHEPEDRPLDIRYEDEHILVVNKPANCVVHPGAGNWEGTLLNALIHHYPDLKQLPRAGIIHRLDKDTTGLMVVTKSQLAHTQLVADLSERLIDRYYVAVVKGRILSGGTIDAPIGRHPKNRLKMAVVKGPGGKPARTHYKVAGRFSGYTVLKLKLESGRTHQIRVHCAHIQHALVGDSRYAGRAQLSANLSPALREAINHFPRPALHAYKLGLTHPKTKEVMTWEEPIPDDLQSLIKELNDNEAYQSTMASAELGESV